MSWFDEAFCSLPEVDLADAILDRDFFVYEEKTKVKIEGPILDIVQSLADGDKELLGNNNLLRHNVTERCKKVVTSQLLEDAIDEAAISNKPKLREIINSNKDQVYDLICGVDDPIRCLDLCRKVRSCHRGMNAVTKKKSVIDRGTTTLGKIMRLSEGFKDIFLIGAKNQKHRMAHHPEVKRACDLYGEGGFYECLDLRNWKEFLVGYDDVIIDVSIAGDDGGMCVPEDYEKMYVEMTKQGKRVLAKVDKFGYVIRNGYFTDFMVYRDHNREVFALVCPEQKDGHDFTADVIDANIFRMAYLKDYNYPFQRTAKGVEDVVCLSIVDRKRERIKHLYNGSVIEQLVPEADYEVGDFYNNSDYQFDCEFDGQWIYGEVELPCVIQDVDFWTRDRRRLLESFNKYYVLEYVDDLGWVAVDSK